MNKFLICLYLTMAIMILSCAGKSERENHKRGKSKGQPRSITAGETRIIKAAIKKSLEKLSKEDSNIKLKLKKINSTTRQKGEDILYTLNIDLIDRNDNQTITCNVTLSSHPKRESGVKMVYECEGREKMLSEEEANETLKYVISKYEEVEMKIIGEPVSIYGLRVSYGDVEEELNIHFKYIDNTQYDIIQNCVFVLQHRQNECELIKTICNTFLPITPRPLLQRKDLRICGDDGSTVQVVEKEETEDNEARATEMTTTDAEQIRTANNGEHDADADGEDEENKSGKVEAADGQEMQ